MMAHVIPTTVIPVVELVVMELMFVVSVVVMVLQEIAWVLVLEEPYLMIVTFVDLE